MDRGTATALADLKMHWEDAYDITVEGGMWKAVNRGYGHTVTANDPHQLRLAIREDYGRNPVLGRMSV